MTSSFPNPRFRCKPFWLRLVTKPGQWVTIAPTIYYPSDLDPLAPTWAALVAHEIVHLAQQVQLGRASWLWRYLTSRRFRLEVEAEAIAAEYLATPFLARAGLLESYAQALAGPAYHHAAPSVAVAFDAISDAIDAREARP